MRTAPLLWREPLQLPVRLPLRRRQPGQPNPSTSGPRHRAHPLPSMSNSPYYRAIRGSSPRPRSPTPPSPPSAVLAQSSTPTPKQHPNWATPTSRLWQPPPNHTNETRRSDRICCTSRRAYTRHHLREPRFRQGTILPGLHLETTPLLGFTRPRPRLTDGYKPAQRSGNIPTSTVTTPCSGNHWHDYTSCPARTTQATIGHHTHHPGTCCPLTDPGQRDLPTQGTFFSDRGEGPHRRNPAKTQSPQSTSRKSPPSTPTRVNRHPTKHLGRRRVRTIPTHTRKQEHQRPLRNRSRTSRNPDLPTNYSRLPAPVPPSTS